MRKKAGAWAIALVRPATVNNAAPMTAALILKLMLSFPWGFLPFRTALRHNLWAPLLAVKQTRK
jgi:hypothetical protein